ncbi:MAG TPA: trehalose-phosphatase [Longimicrobiales bacterium]|nr:trehalose-phosphatase [Longimicrobiales bacterium]
MLPHAIDLVPDLQRRRQAAGRMLVAVDFDGTLAPIVERPEDAAPLPAGIDALRRLAARPDTDVAIVSGRGLEDARARVGLEGLYYAGNHGMEIEGPGIARVLEAAAAQRPRLERCRERLEEELAGMEGAQIEDKGLTLSIHYRRVPTPEDRDAVVRRVHATCRGTPGVRLTAGKMVVEIRPDVAWDKGAATRFLLDTLEGALGRPVPALFLGDDRTDEDAFRVLAEEGGGILVTEQPPADTAAGAWLRSPAEVARFLDLLAADGNVP